MHDQWQSPFHHYLSSSFLDLLRTQRPDLLPDLPGRGAEPGAAPMAPVATTILALRYRDGVLMAGDRQAIEGFQVAHRRIEKIYKADGHSAIAIAGTAGPSLEMARLFQTELEHYEKVEGEGLSLEGKANKLAQMVRLNLPAALQGLIVIPIFAGYDLRRGEGRIFKYDITGGRYEELDHYATGSGGKDARNALKRLWRPDLSREESIRAAVEALIDAAEEDVGTGGPDLIRGIFPSLKLISRQGYEEIPDEEVERVCRAVLEGRREGRPRAVPGVE